MKSERCLCIVPGTRAKGKRETGANPVRSRHCDGGEGRLKTPLGKRLGRQRAFEDPSARKPAVRLGTGAAHAAPDHEELVVPYAAVPAAAMLLRQSLSLLFTSIRRGFFGCCRGWAVRCVLLYRFCFADETSSYIRAAPLHRAVGTDKQVRRNT